MKTDYTPSVSVIIASSGEDEITIRSKIKNTFELNYPIDKLEILFFSDGADLNVSQLSADYESIKFIQFDKIGKTECQNRCVDIAKGEIIICTDVSAHLSDDSLLKTVRWFADPRVGSVGGYFKYRFKKTSIEDSYLEKEMKKKMKQSRYGFVIGYFGPIYSFRKILYKMMPPFYTSDYILPLDIYANGNLSIFDKEILSYRNIDRELESEFNRKRRIIAQGLISTVHFMRNKWKIIYKKADLFSTIITHKMFRWFIMPYFLFVYACSIYFNFFSIQISIVLLSVGILSFIASKSGVKMKWTLTLYYLIIVLMANLFGIVDALRGKKYIMWQPGSN